MQCQVLFFTILLFVVGISGCTPEKGNPINNVNGGTTVTTTIAGVVTADNYAITRGLVITAHGRTTTTDEHGFYIIRNVSVPEDRCIVKVENPGYFTLSRMSVPKAGGLTRVHIGILTSNSSYSIQAQDGGSIALLEGGTIEMPVGGTDGYKPVDANHLYMDQVKVTARCLYPIGNNISTDFQLCTPGSLGIRRSDSSTTFLYSYGVLSMFMYMHDGGELQFGGGKKAVLICPIDPSVVNSAPTEVPMWYFDEKIGMWQEEGKAVKQGENYVGEIARTGKWNIAAPVPTAILKGQVKCGGDAVTSIHFYIGRQYEAWTDDNGNYECRVPAGVPLEFYIDVNKNLGNFISSEIVVEPLAEGQVVTRDITIEPSIASITGTIVDCNNKPVEGYVEATVSGMFSYAVSDAKGVFKLRTKPNGGITALRVTSFDGRNRSLLQATLPAGAVQNLGNVSLCPDAAPAFSTIALNSTNYTVLSLSDDGTRVVVGGENDVRVFETKTGQLLRTFSFQNCSHVQISPDKTRCLASKEFTGGSEAKTTVWDIASGDPLLTLPSSYSSFMPDNRTVITRASGTSTGATIVTYSISTGEEERRFVIPIAITKGYVTGTPNIVGVVANGTKGVLKKIDYNNVDQQAQIIIFDIEKGTILNERRTYNRSVGNIRVAANGEILGLCEGGNPVILYQNDGTQYLGLYAQSNSHYALSPDAKYFTVQKNAGEPVNISDITPNGPVLNRYLEVPEATAIIDLAYSLDGKTLAGLWQGGIIIWRL